MRISILLLYVGILSISASGYSQDAIISVHVENKTVEEVFSTIKAQTDYSFWFNIKDVDLDQRVSLDVTNATVKSVLVQTLENQNVEFAMYGNHIIITQKGSFSAMAGQQQGILVIGSVVDEKVEPIPGANVVVKGTTTGVVTNYDGTFSITVPDKEAILVFSFVGYISREFVVGDQKEINVILNEDLRQIEEVVVVGYGTQKKVNLTGAVSTVKIDEHFASRSVASTSSGLNGLVPGLMVQQGTGMAGKDGAVLRIRGLGTTNNTNPLIVVDGMPDVDINRIDMNDIESISVLKDASASAVYGSRAANGVLLITTKRGKEGKVNINYSGNFSIGHATDFYDFLTDYPRALSLHNQAAMNGGSSIKYKDGTIEEWLGKGMVDPILYPNTDWSDVIMRSPFMQNHSLSATGGTDKSSFYISAGYLDQEGLLITNDFNRYSFRANIEQRIRKSIKVGANLVGQWSNQTYPMDDGLVQYSSTFNFDGLARAVAGVLPQHPITGEYGGAMAYGEDAYAFNALSYVASYKKKTTRKDFNGFGFLEWQPFDYLQFKVDYGITYRNDFTKSYGMPTTWMNFQTGLPGNVYIAESAGVTDSTNEWYKTLLNAHVVFDKEIFKGHHLRFQGIYSEEYWNDRSQSSSRTKRWNPNLHEVNAAETETQTAGGTSSAEGLRSIVGKLNYELFDRYLFQALVRWDGSSKFTEGHQWGTFPSFSAGWRFSEEEFFTSIKHIVNSGKLRGSWGKVGNNSGVGRYEQKDTYSATFYNFAGGLSSGYSSAKIIDPDFTWETSTVSNIGLELGFLDMRLRTELELYKKLTTGMIRPGEISRFLSGYSAPKMNIGEIQNTGIETTVSWQDNIRDFRYGAVVNYAYNKNELLKWNQRLGRGNIFIGYPYFMAYAYVTKGIVQSWDEIDNSAFQSDNIAPGDLLMEDTNGDGFIDSNDMVAMPKYNRRIPSHDFSLNLNAAWKGIDVLVFLQGNAGRKDFWRDDFNRVDTYDTRYNFQNFHLDTWSLENRSASLPRLVTGNNGGFRHDQSTFWLYSCDYLRLKNLQVGYSFPQSILRHIWLSSLRIYFSAENILTFTNWPGLDPEKLPTYESATNPYPLLKTYSVGINITL